MYRENGIIQFDIFKTCVKYIGGCRKSSFTPQGMTWRLSNIGVKGFWGREEIEAHLRPPWPAPGPSLPVSPAL